MSSIHPTAIIDRGAEIGSNVEIGPYCVIGPHVTIGDNTRLYNHVTIMSKTTVGKGNIIYPNAVLGAPPQDLKYKGTLTALEIGDNNQIREAVTVHAGTETGVGVTRLGSGNLLMINTHIGHDSQFGSKCILGNNTMIAGHVECGDGVAMMGGVGVHHFVTIGNFAYIGGYSRIHHDVPPFVKVDGADKVRALNNVGLKRHGFTEDDIEALEDAARRLFFGREKPFAIVLNELSDGDVNPQVKQMIDFLHRRNAGRHGRYLESLRVK